MPHTQKQEESCAAAVAKIRNGELVMELGETVHGLFVRLEPGEPIIESLKDVARRKHVRVGAITSGVGMLSSVKFGFFCARKDDYDVHQLDEILDLSSILGNITWSGAEPIPHVHMTMNNSRNETFSGHIIEAWCHITMEIFIFKFNDLNLHRVKVPGMPATRITSGQQ